MGNLDLCIVSDCQAQHTEHHTGPTQQGAGGGVGPVHHDDGDGVVGGARGAAGVLPLVLLLHLAHHHLAQAGALPPLLLQEDAALVEPEVERPASDVPASDSIQNSEEDS